MSVGIPGEGGPIDKLVQIGFSEYEAKAYVALLRESPVTGYQLAKTSGVPRSMIYEVLGKLTARGAAMTLRKEGSTLYAPIPAGEFLAQLQHEQDALIGALEQELAGLDAASDLDYVWNIEGHENVMAKAREMIGQARERIYLSLLPATYAALQDALQRAIGRGVQVVVYSTGELDLPGGRVIANPVPGEVHERVEGLWLVLVVDAKEVLVGELLTENRARASWTGSPLFVFIAEHHLRTDLYLPRVLSLLGEQARSLIQEEDRELFACAFESRLAW
ncbi:MAG: TrmB family transcriptional regulator [Anaerolineae bacterium]|jgi:sugar-specific transcriptional regulator TrmB